MADSGNNTYVDPQAVRSTADHIGGLMDDMQPFHALAGAEPKAGNFETATWLESLVRERQQGLLQHALDIKLTVGDVKTSLHEIATTFEQADEDNANSLSRDLYHEVNVMKIKAYESGQEAKELAAPAPDTSGSDAGATDIPPQV
jgi:hypothetical protein